MAVTFEITENFALPPEQVFEAMTDLGQARHWMQGFVRIELLTQGPLGVGTKWREVRKMMGREAGEVFEVTGYDPPRSFRLYVDGKLGASRKGYYDFIHTLTPTATGTRLVLAGEIGGLKGLSALLAKYLMKGMFTKAIAKDFAAFRQYLESKHTPPAR